MKQSPSVFLREGREIEESGNVVHIQQMNLFGPTREAQRDDRNAREVGITFPRLERQGSEEIVLAKHHVGTLLPGRVDRVGDPDDTSGLDA